MADPITIIGTAGAIANIVDLLGKTISTLNDLQNQWKIADLTVMAFKSQLLVFKEALRRILAWAEGTSTENHHELLLCLESSVMCCRLLVAKIDDEVTQLETTAEGQLNLASKVKLLFKTKDMEEVQRKIDQQTHALNLLLSVCNLNALEQKRLVQQPQVVRVFRQVEKDTASLVVHRDADSVVTSSSISSSQLAVKFDFDRELFVTKVYERWIRHRLRRTRQNQTHYQAGKQPVREPTPDQGDDKPNPNDVQDESSRQLSRQTSTSSRQLSSNPLFRNPIGGLSFELKPLKRSLEALPLRTNRNTSFESDLQKRHSRAIDRQLEGDSKRLQREIKVLLLGAESRQDILKQMKIIHLKGYSDEELQNYNPTVIGYLVFCAKALSQAVQTSPTLKSGIAQKHCEFIDGYSTAGSGLWAQLSPEFTATLTSMLELQPVAAMIKSETLLLPDSSAYFFENISRIASPGYIPTETDVLRVRPKTTGIYETRLILGQISLHIFDIPSASTGTRKWIHCFDTVTSIIFVVDLNCYDQVQFGSTQNQLMESLLEFDFLVNSRWLERASIILLLNQVDQFRYKLLSSPLENHFRDYTGGNDVNNAAKYILRRFNEVNRAHLNIYPHLTDVNDTSNIRLVFAAIKETILYNSLRPRKS